MNSADARHPLAVTAAVCACNERGYLRDVVASLLAQSLNSTAFEILIIDNASSDGSAELLSQIAREHPGCVRVIREEQRGLSIARNRALREAHGGIVAFIDADAMAHADWLREIVDQFERHSEAGAAGGPVCVQWDHPRPEWWSPGLDEALNAWDQGHEEKQLEYPRYPYGTNFAVRRAAALSAGGFAAARGRQGRRLIAGEEGELCLRMERAGWSVRFAPRAIVHHRTAASRLTRSYVVRRAWSHGRSQRVLESMHGLPDRQPSAVGIGWMVMKHLLTLRVNWPFMKFIVFRAGYRWESWRQRRVERDPSPQPGGSEAPRRIGAIVQARMSSSRLPGKVLRHIAGRPMLDLLLERLAHCRLIDETIVATSNDPSDDAIAAHCRDRGVACFRGSLDNVASRFAQAAIAHEFSAFVRICADSPLLDPSLVDLAVAVHRIGEHEMVTNVMPRSYPKGQSVEVISRECFERALARMDQPEHLEHVTSFFYDHAEKFRIYNLRSQDDSSDVRLVVDTAEDLETIQAIVEAMDRPQWQYGLDEILELRREVIAARQPIRAAG